MRHVLFVAAAGLVGITFSVSDADAYQAWLRINSDICMPSQLWSGYPQTFCPIPFQYLAWGVGNSGPPQTMAHLYIDEYVSSAGATNNYQACINPAWTGGIITCGAIASYSGTGYVSLQPDLSAWAGTTNADYPAVYATVDTAHVSFNGMAITTAN